MSAFYNAAKVKKRQAGTLSPSSSGRRVFRRTNANSSVGSHRRTNSNSSIKSAFSTFATTHALSNSVDAYVEQYNTANTDFDLNELVNDVTNNHLHPNSEQPWAYKLASQTQTQLSNMRGRLNGRKDANDAAIHGCITRAQTLEVELAKAFDTMTGLDNRKKEITEQLVKATIDYHSLKQSKFNNEAAKTANFKENSSLHFQLYFIDRLESNDAQMQKPLSGMVPLEEAKKVLHLFNWESFVGLSGNDIAKCLLILSNLGLEHNNHFQELWNRPRVGTDADIWGKVQFPSPFLATGKRESPIIKMRLATYLDIPVPHEFFFQHYGNGNGNGNDNDCCDNYQGDDDSVGLASAGGELPTTIQVQQSNSGLGSVPEKGPIDFNHISNEDLIALVRARGIYPQKGSSAPNAGGSKSACNGTDL